MSASQAERRGFDPRLPLHFFCGPYSATDRHGSANSTTTRGTAFPRNLNGGTPARTDGACEAGGGAERARPQAGGAKRAEFDSPLMGTGLEVRQGTAAAVGSVPSARGAKPPRRALSRPSGGSASEPFGHARKKGSPRPFGQTSPEIPGGGSGPHPRLAFVPHTARGAARCPPLRPPHLNQICPNKHLTTPPPRCKVIA